MENKSKFTNFCLFLLLMSISACGGGDDGTTSIDNTLQNEIVGGDIGNNTTPVGQLRKVVPINFNTPNPDFSFSDVYLARPGISSNAVYWAVYGKNISSETHCFIRMNDGVAKNISGTTILLDIISYVDGSVRKLDLSGVETSTCLSPGETGLFTGIDIVSNAYDDITAITYDTITSSRSPAANIDPVIIPTGKYSVENGTFQILRIGIKNSGTAAGSPTGFSKYVLNDSNGNPLIWGYIQPETAEDAILAVNANGTLIDDIVIYDGVSRQISVVIDYNSYTSPVSLTGFASLSAMSYTNQDYVSRAIQQQRNETEAYKEFIATQ